MIRRGYITISKKLVREHLGIKGEIVAARIDYFSSGNLELVIEGDDMPECPEGCYPEPVELLGNEANK